MSHLFEKMEYSAHIPTLDFNFEGKIQLYHLQKFEPEGFSMSSRVSPLERGKSKVLKKYSAGAIQ